MHAARHIAPTRDPVMLLVQALSHLDISDNHLTSTLPSSWRLMPSLATL